MAKNRLVFFRFAFLRVDSGDTNPDLFLSLIFKVARIDHKWKGHLIHSFENYNIFHNMTCQTFTHIYFKRPLGRFPHPLILRDMASVYMMLSNHVNIYLLIGFTSTDISFCWPHPPPSFHLNYNFKKNVMVSYFLSMFGAWKLLEALWINEISWMDF